MNVNIDENVSKLLPWDLTMTIDGGNWRTRRPAVSLIVRLSEAKSLGTRDSIDLIGAMFDEPRPDVGAWGPEVLPLVVAGYLRYFNEFVQKNSLRVAELLRPAAQIPTTPAAPPAGDSR